MSYEEYDGIFDYTLQFLKDCERIMNGSDQHHRRNPCKWEDYMSSIEYHNMKDLIRICRRIVKDVDNEENVFLPKGCCD